MQEVQKWEEFETFDMWRACKSNASCKAAVLVPHKLAFALRWSSSELLKNTLSYVSAVVVETVGVISAYFPDQTKPDSSWMKCADELVLVLNELKKQKCGSLVIG